jgi:hypothetical protein
MAVRHLTDEKVLVGTLCRSRLPTVIVEGKEDHQIYQWVEKCTGIQKANVLSVGGRETLLAVYKRRNEYAHLPVAFVADRDLWLFSGIPSDYPDVIWTQGYSIENDLYADADLENLLNADEVDEHQQVLDIIIEWFAFEVEEHLAGREARVATHCNQVVRPGKTEMDQGFRNSRGFRSSNQTLHQRIKDAYQLQLRGKTLFQVLVRFLSAANRRPKHSTSGLYEFAVKMISPQPLIDRLIDEIERAIAEHTSPN